MLLCFSNNNPCQFKTLNQVVMTLSSSLNTYDDLPWVDNECKFLEKLRNPSSWLNLRNPQWGYHRRLKQVFYYRLAGIYKLGHIECPPSFNLFEPETNQDYPPINILINSIQFPSISSSRLNWMQRLLWGGLLVKLSATPPGHRPVLSPVALSINHVHCFHLFDFSPLCVFDVTSNEDVQGKVGNK